MTVCLCDISAQWFWRHYAPKSDEPVFGHTPGEGPLLPSALPSRCLPIEEGLERLDKSPGFEAMRMLGSSGYPNGEALHVLAPRSLKTSPTKKMVVHCLENDPPFGSMLRYGKDLCVTSPAHTLLHACSKLEFHERLKLAYEFCGCYSIRPDLEGGMLLRHPITSAEELRIVCAEASGIDGAKKLRQVLPFVVDGSASPRETALVLILCLPKRYGGFGLPYPKMNVCLNLGPSAARLWGHANAFDLVWTEQKIILEYDGIAAHSADPQWDRDQRRREAAASAGYTVFVLNKRRLESVSDTYAVVERIAKGLGFRLKFTEGFREKHLALRQALL